jgi:hypothetical protein
MHGERNETRPAMPATMSASSNDPFMTVLLKLSPTLMRTAQQAQP